MGVDIDGCIEIYKQVGFDSPPEWVGVALIPDLVERSYALFGLLLDVRTRDDVFAPFANRGLPDDMSPVTFDQVRLIGGIVKPSWILWTEIDSMKLQIEALGVLDSLRGWQACFAIMAAAAHYYGGDHVRLVAWCDME